jgi:hypothetical protein
MGPFEWVIRRRAENAMMRQYGYSRAYVQEVIRNNDALVLGTISYDVWQRRCLAIAYRYPDDTEIALQSDREEVFADA